MFGRLGWAEILVIVVLLVILFGSRKIPGMMKNLADGVNVFKRELKTTTSKKEKQTEIVDHKTKVNVKKSKKTVGKRPLKNKTKK